MTLKKHFEQRVIETTPGSMRSPVPLRTPSGPQWAESALEAELLQQLAFAPNVFDLLTQPIIHYVSNGKKRQYTPDIAVQLNAAGGDPTARYLIEVKREEDLVRNSDKYTIPFEAGRLAAEEMAGAFRIMTEDQIRTPYLGNMRKLVHYQHKDLEDRTVEAMDALEDAGAISVSKAIELLRQKEWTLADARFAIEQGVAWRLLICDLSQSFNDDRQVSVSPLGALFDPRGDYILRLLKAANSA